MLNLDAAGKLAKNAIQELQKAEKSGGDAGGTAKNILDGVKTVEKLAGLQEKAPEPLITALRKLIAQAAQLTNKNDALSACVQKAQTLLDSGDSSAEAVTKLTAELGALLKGGAQSDKQPGGVQKDAAPASKSDAGKNEASVRTAPSPKPAVHFSDVDTGAYYYEAVQWAVQEGIASGTTETTFSPDQNCTRAQTITLLWRAAGSPAPASQSNPFSDVRENAYYYSAVLWAAERGIVSGPAFDPDTAVTRGQLAAFLYRNAGSPAVADSNAFTDVPSNAYYHQAVAWVAARGITSGTGEHTFSPDAACTRGQIVTFLYRAKK